MVLLRQKYKIGVTPDNATRFLREEALFVRAFPRMAFQTQDIKEEFGKKLHINVFRSLNGDSVLNPSTPEYIITGGF